MSLLPTLRRALRTFGASLGVLAVVAGLVTAPMAFAFEKPGCGGCGTAGDGCGSACCLLLKRMVDQGLVPPDSGGDCGHGAAPDTTHPGSRNAPVVQAPQGCPAGCPGVQVGSSFQINATDLALRRWESIPAVAPVATDGSVRRAASAALPPTPPRGPPLFLARVEL